MRRDFIQVILKCEQLKAGQWVGNVGVRGGMREMRVIRNESECVCERNESDKKGDNPR